MEKIVPNEQAFWFCDSNGWVGKIAHSLSEFAAEVKSVPIESLEFHLRDDKNDFEAWVSGVVGKKTLSKKIAKVKHRNLKGEDLRSAILDLL